MPNPLGDKKGCNVGFFFFFFFPVCSACLVISYPAITLGCFFTRALFWVIGWWEWFLYGMGVREKWEPWRQKWEIGSVVKGGNPRGKAELSAGEDKETQHKSTVNQPNSGSVWNNLFNECFFINKCLILETNSYTFFILPISHQYA